MKNSSDTIGNRTGDLPVCSEVPQPSAPPRAPILPTCISKFCQHQKQTENKQTNKQKRRNDNQITKGKWWDFRKEWRDKLDARQTGLGESVFVVFFFDPARRSKCRQSFEL